MLEPSFIKNNPEKVKADLKRRNQDYLVSLVDQFLEKDEKSRSLKKDLDQLRHKRNVISEEINNLVKKGGKPINLINQAKSLPGIIKESEKEFTDLDNEIQAILYKIPNILHKSVPKGKNADDNKVVHKFGSPKKSKFDLVSHGELLEKKNLAEFHKASTVSGSGFVYLKGNLALLDLALQRFAIDFLLKKNYTLVQPPFMLHKEPYKGVVSMDDFKNMMYKLEDQDLYLIATSEHPLTVLYKDSLFNERDLPIKLVGISTNFRKEIGSHGVDTRGLFRMHQFNKIEQIIISNQENSWKFLEEIQENAEQLMKKLRIPFRVVNVCTGDIGMIAAKKYDIEAWFPRENTYKEVTSASNCTSYQAVRLNIKYLDKKSKGKKYVHTLNATAIATSRIMRAIIENYQQKNGSIVIPTVLRKYMNDIKKIE